MGTIAEKGFHRSVSIECIHGMKDSVKKGAGSNLGANPDFLDSKIFLKNDCFSNICCTVCRARANTCKQFFYKCFPQKFSFSILWARCSDKKHFYPRSYFFVRPDFFRSTDRSFWSKSGNAGSSPEIGIFSDVRRRPVFFGVLVFERQLILKRGLYYKTQWIHY